MIRRLLVLLATVLVVAGPAVPAAAQSAANVRIREAVLDADGATRVVVSVTGDDVPDVLDASAFTVSESGREIGSLTVEPLLESQETTPVSVALVIDVSGSTQGEPLDQAKAAAIAFVDQLLVDEVTVGLYAFGATVAQLTPFTDDANELRTAIEQLEAAGETALYDAIVSASEGLSGLPGQHNLVIFSDGADTVSASELGAAVDAATAAGAPITNVALATPEQDPEALEQLASGSGGATVSVGEAAGLATAFETVARQIASQYVLAYESTETEPAELDLTVAVATGEVTGSDTITVSNLRDPAVVQGDEAPERRPVEPAQPLVAAFTTRTGLLIGIGATFVALVLLLGAAVVSVGGSRAERVMKRGLRFYASGGRDRKAVELTGATMSQRAANLVDRVPKPAGFDERLQEQLEQASWPIRTGEFVAFQIAAAFGGALAVWALTGSPLGGVIGFLIGMFVPRLILMRKIDRRQRAFMAQLPETLQLLAGSLKAGYGLLQAIDTVVKEASPPTSQEFARVLTEARLGLPLEDALSGMAERTGSDDFRWVVMAINIQKQVGGNLAHLLEVVAETLREREQVRRTIKTLSAEGRLSAVILSALPFVLAGYLALASRAYLAELFNSTVGIFMMIGSVVLMSLGAVWMRKLISIDV